MTAYYNEIDKYAAQWLRNLIAEGVIAPGDVDERSIEDVRPVDLLGYTQCHFFAGIGVWSYALRRAGWRDEWPVWTGSCPCQPFSAAGKGGGFDDDRHLWPAWEWLIRHAKPRAVLVFGEQVASKPGLAWVDAVHADMERQGHTVGAVDLCAAGVGAPHIRQRLYFVADPGHNNRAARTSRCEHKSETSVSERIGSNFSIGGMGNAANESRERNPGAVPAAQEGLDGARQSVDGRVPLGSEHAGSSVARFLEDAECATSARLGQHGRERIRFEETTGLAGPGGTRGWWRDADWLDCTDGKARPVEPGTFPLAHGATARVGRLRAYGNAIVAPCAEEFIRAYLESAALNELL